jgi:hypothetical protein
LRVLDHFVEEAGGAHSPGKTPLSSSQSRDGYRIVLKDITNLDRVPDARFEHHRSIIAFNVEGRHGMYHVFKMQVTSSCGDTIAKGNGLTKLVDNIVRFYLYLGAT